MTGQAYKTPKSPWWEYLIVVVCIVLFFLATRWVILNWVM